LQNGHLIDYIAGNMDLSSIMVQIAQFLNMMPNGNEMLRILVLSMASMVAVILNEGAE